MMRISAFGDEIAVDFEEQLQDLQGLEIPLIDIRAAWGVNCSEFTHEHVGRIKGLMRAIRHRGRMYGQSHRQVADWRRDRYRRRASQAHRRNGASTGTRNIRLFSFYPDGDTDDAAMQQSIERLGTLTDIAAENDLQLLLENEKGVVGDLPERCLQIMQAIDYPHFRFIWDPANFVQCGAAEQVDKWWDRLSPHIGYIHIKDALLADKSVTVAGDGNGQLPELLTRLQESGYEGVLSLEPHLLEARHSAGFSGAEGMALAVGALRKLMAAAGIEEGK